jgi:hypothetical protein
VAAHAIRAHFAFAALVSAGFLSRQRAYTLAMTCFARSGASFETRGGVHFPLGILPPGLNFLGYYLPFLHMLAKFLAKPASGYTCTLAEFLAASFQRHINLYDES